MYENPEQAASMVLAQYADFKNDLVFPIDPVDIARMFHIVVKKEPLPYSAAGYLLKENNKPPVISVNQNDARRRQRFTYAHELGHFWLHKNDSSDFGYAEYRDDLSSHGVDPNEIWANQFAAQLLMPRREVLLAWARGDSISSIQDRFDVSDAALGNRLINLGLLSSDAS